MLDGEVGAGKRADAKKGLGQVGLGALDED